MITRLNSDFCSNQKLNIYIVHWQFKGSNISLFSMLTLICILKNLCKYILKKNKKTRHQASSANHFVILVNFFLSLSITRNQAYEFSPEIIELLPPPLRGRTQILENPSQQFKKQKKNISTLL